MQLDTNYGMPSQLKAPASPLTLAMRTTNAQHLGASGSKVAGAGESEGFLGHLQQALGGLERLDTNAKKLSMQAAYDPNSVEVHQVLIASSKARFAMNLTKTITEGLIRSFKELSSPR